MGLQLIKRNWRENEKLVRIVQYHHCQKAKRGRPLLLGDTLDNQVKEYVRSVREGGGLITTEITIAAAKAICSEI